MNPDLGARVYLSRKPRAQPIPAALDAGRRAPGRMNSDGSGSSSRLQRLTEGRRTRRPTGLQTQVREHLLDHRCFQGPGAVATAQSPTAAR